MLLQQYVKKLNTNKNKTSPTLLESDHFLAFTIHSICVLKYLLNTTTRFRNNLPWVPSKSKDWKDKLVENTLGPIKPIGLNKIAKIG